MIENYKKVRSEFDKKANTYDKQHSGKYTTMGLREAIRRNHIIKIVKHSEKLLSIGCGTCWYLKYFSQEGYQCFGVDISLKMLEQCKQKVQKVCLASGEDLPFMNQTFDHVLCSNMLQYVDDPLSLFLEVKRVMKGEGLLIFDFKNFLSFRAVAHFFFRVFQQERKSDNEKRYTIFKIRKFLRQADFEISKMVGMDFDFFQTNRKLRSKPLVNILETIESLLAETPLKFFSGRLMLSVTKKMQNQRFN